MQLDKTSNKTYDKKSDKTYDKKSDKKIGQKNKTKKSQEISQEIFKISSQIPPEISTKNLHKYPHIHLQKSSPEIIPRTSL